MYVLVFVLSCLLLVHLVLLSCFVVYYVYRIMHVCACCLLHGSTPINWLGDCSQAPTGGGTPTTTRDMGEAPMFFRGVRGVVPSLTIRNFSRPILDVLHILYIVVYMFVVVVVFVLLVR